ncbi:MAG: hypothetical protein V4459_14080 [Pseudomonadota bacterium]
MPLWRYFDFTGRSRRLEFWLFFLLRWRALVLFGAFTIATIIPSIAPANILVTK